MLINKILLKRDAASDISKLVNCPEEIIREFATLAIKKNAFGDPSEWTAIQVIHIIYPRHLLLLFIYQCFYYLLGSVYRLCDSWFGFRQRHSRGRFWRVGRVKYKMFTEPNVTSKWSKCYATVFAPRSTGFWLVEQLNYIQIGRSTTVRRMTTLIEFKFFIAKQNHVGQSFLHNINLKHIVLKLYQKPSINKVDHVHFDPQIRRNYKSVPYSRRAPQGEGIFTILYQFFFSFNYHLFKNENILIRVASDS